MSVYRTTATGSAAIAASMAAPSGQARRLVSVGVHFGVAPAAAGSLTVTLDAAAGAAYDTLLQSASMVGVTDWLWLPEQELILMPDDAVAVVYANADGRTYGVHITLKAV